MPTLSQLQQNFLDTLHREQKRGGTTITGYGRALQRFVTWLQHTVKTSEVAPADLTAERLASFGRWLRHFKQPSGAVLSAAAQNYHLSAVRSFLGYLKTKGQTTLGAMHLPLTKAGRPEVALLSGEELARLLEAPLQTKEHPLVKLRDRALLELLLTTGLKTSALANLQRAQLSSDGSTLTTTKHHLPAQAIVLSNLARYHLGQYLAARNDSSTALWVRHDRAGREQIDSLTPRSIQRVLEHYRKQANITKRLTPGSLRHAFAAQLLRAGADSASVSTLLGHASLGTLKLYRYHQPEP